MTVGKKLINEVMVDLDVSLNTKEDVIKYLVEKMVEEDYVSDMDQFVEDVYYRESLGITGIGNHVAIPHGKSKGVKKPALAVCRTKEFIEWESYDDEPVKLIFLFAVPDDTEGSKDHLKMLAAVSTKLANDTILNKLLSAEDVSVFSNIINND